MGLGNSGVPALQPGYGTFGLPSLPNIKKHLRAKRFKSHDDVKHEMQTWLCVQDRVFEKWISHLDKCVNREGDYVEK